MEEKEKENHQGEGGGYVSRARLYKMVANKSKKAIEVVYKLMLTSKNEAVQLGAAKIILAKSIPDLQSQEFSGKDGEPLAIKLEIPNAGSVVSFTKPVPAETTGSME